VTTRRCDWRQQRLGRLRRRQKPSAAIASQSETPTELCSAQNRPSSANITLRVSNTGSVDSASVPSGITVTGGRYSGRSELPAIPARSTSDVVVRSRSYQIDQLRPETCHCSTADGCQLYRVDGGRHELMPTPNNGARFTAALFEKSASGFNGKCYVVSAYAAGTKSPLSNAYCSAGGSVQATATLRPSHVRSWLQIHAGNTGCVIRVKT